MRERWPASPAGGSILRRVPGRVLQHGSLLLGRRFADHPGADLRDPPASVVDRWVTAFIEHVAAALELSRRSELFAGYILTTNLADGGGTVRCRPNQYPRFNTRQRIALETAAIDVNKRVLLPPKTWWQEATLPRRHRRAVEVSRELGLNRMLHTSPSRKAVGFITSGLAHGYLMQALWELGLLGEFPVLKFGLTYPLDAELIGRLADQCERIVVVEERRGFLEEQAAEALQSLRQSGRLSGAVDLWGKRFPEDLEGIPETRGLNPSILIERLAALLELIETASRITVDS